MPVRASVGVVYLTRGTERSPSPLSRQRAGWMSSDCMNTHVISVIIPAYNEAARIRRTLESVQRYVADNRIPAEIIVVDDGSTDGTADVVGRYASSVANLKILPNGMNKGKGFSVRRGMLAAAGDYRLFIDADSSVDISHLDAFLRAAKKGSDIVIGSIHTSKESDVFEHNGWHRRLLGSGATMLIRLLAVPGIRDTQRGFKLFSAKAAETIFLRQTIERFGFDIELLVIAHENGLKIQELPVAWDNPAGSKVTIFSYLHTLGELIRISYNRLRGTYAAAKRDAQVR